MESKRFPRVNSLKPASPDDPEGERFDGMGGKADGQRPGAAKAGNSPPPVDLGGNESPAWQDYFFLAPNVRFTRTPDYEASTRHPRHDQIASSKTSHWRRRRRKPSQNPPRRRRRLSARRAAGIRLWMLPAPATEARTMEDSLPWPPVQPGIPAKRRGRRRVRGQL